MWGVYPEAMVWNVGAVHSEINLGECIWRSSPKRANLKVYFDICPFWATSPDTLTQIDFWVHSANIPGHCLWIDTPHAYVWATWNFHFLMGGPRFEVNFPPSKILWKAFLAKYPKSIHKMAAKNASRFLKTLLLTFLTRPIDQLWLTNNRTFQTVKSKKFTTKFWKNNSRWRFVACAYIK